MRYWMHMCPSKGVGRWFENHRDREVEGARSRTTPFSGVLLVPLHDACNTRRERHTVTIILCPGRGATHGLLLLRVALGGRYFVVGIVIGTGAGRNQSWCLRWRPSAPVPPALLTPGSAGFGRASHPFVSSVRVTCQWLSVGTHMGFYTLHGTGDIYSFPV